MKEAMVDAETERKLLEYLAEGKTERVDVRSHMRANTTALQRIFHQLELHEQKDDARHAEVKNALAGLHSRVERLERDSESTGKHNVEELREENKTMKAQSFTWKQLLVGAAITAALMIGGGLMGLLTTLAMKGR